MDELFRDFALWLWKFLTVSAILLAVAHFFGRRSRSRQKSSKPPGADSAADSQENSSAGGLK